jgi:uncharacterized caspase-like protein
MQNRIWILLLVCCVVALGQPATSGPTRRRALLIVNSKYAPKIPDVPVDGTGAKLLEKALETAGFGVTLRENLNFDDLTDAIDSFQTTIQRGDISFFYYSGYIAQYPRGDFLLPVGFDPTSNRESYDVADGFS